MAKRYGPLKPYTDWPQDNLRIPNGQGLMPRVDFENGYNTRREGAVYTDPLPYSFPIGTGTKFDRILPIEADADFWMTEIVIYSNQASLNPPGFKLNISDIRTGYSLMRPHVRTNIFDFRDLLAVNTGVGSAVAHSSIIQPYCFTRNGGIRIVIENDLNLAGAVDMYISFIGWKEYVYAAQ